MICTMNNAMQHSKITNTLLENNLRGGESNLESVIDLIDNALNQFLIKE